MQELATRFQQIDSNFESLNVEKETLASYIELIRVFFAKMMFYEAAQCIERVEMLIAIYSEENQQADSSLELNEHKQTYYEISGIGSRRVRPINTQEAVPIVMSDNDHDTKVTGSSAADEYVDPDEALKNKRAYLFTDHDFLQARRRLVRPRTTKAMRYLLNDVEEIWSNSQSFYEFRQRIGDQETKMYHKKTVINWITKLLVQKYMFNYIESHFPNNNLISDTLNSEKESSDRILYRAAGYRALNQNNIVIPSPDSDVEIDHDIWAWDFWKQQKKEKMQSLFLKQWVLLGPTIFKSFPINFGSGGRYQRVVKRDYYGRVVDPDYVDRHPDIKVEDLEQFIVNLNEINQEFEELRVNPFNFSGFSAKKHELMTTRNNDQVNKIVVRDFLHRVGVELAPSATEHIRLNTHNIFKSHVIDKVIIGASLDEAPVDGINIDALWVCSSYIGLRNKKTHTIMMTVGIIGMQCFVHYTVFGHTDNNVVFADKTMDENLERMDLDSNSDSDSGLDPDFDYKMSGGEEKTPDVPELAKKIPIFYGHKTKIPLNISTFSHYLFNTWDSFSNANMDKFTATLMFMSQTPLVEKIKKLREIENRKHIQLRCHWTSTDSQYGKKMEQANYLLSVTYGNAHMCALPQNMARFHPCKQIMTHLKAHIAKYPNMPLKRVMRMYTDQLLQKNMILRVIRHCYYHTTFGKSRPHPFDFGSQLTDITQEALDADCNEPDPKKIPNYNKTGHLVCYSPETHVVAKMLPVSRHRWHVLSQKTALFDNLKGKMLQTAAKYFYTSNIYDFLMNENATENVTLTKTATLGDLLVNKTFQNMKVDVEFTWFCMTLTQVLYKATAFALHSEEGSEFIAWPAAGFFLVLHLGQRISWSAVCSFLCDDFYPSMPMPIHQKESFEWISENNFGIIQI